MQLSEHLLALMLRIVEQQDDPTEKAAMLDIMRRDGWLPGESDAA